MTYPGIGTTNPAHQLETTSNVTAESLEIYSDYTFFGSAEYDWARQLRLRVNTPSSSNVFVDMGLEKDGGDYFYISKPLSAAVDPKNNFRIYQNGRILINRTDASRTERLQVEGDVKVTGNLNVTGTTTVRGDVGITGDLHVTSFNQEKNYIVPEGMIVMWDGAVADIPPGWALVTGVSGYYLRSDPTQTSVQTGGETSNVINSIGAHTHNLTSPTPASGNHNHNLNFGNMNNSGRDHGHAKSFNAWTPATESHTHEYEDIGATIYKGSTNTVTGAPQSYDQYNNTLNLTGAHTHTIYFNVGTSGSHTHNYENFFSSVKEKTHTHGLGNTGGNAITVDLTPTYRQIRLIKKLPYT
jgi:hypothetical protein